MGLPLEGIKVLDLSRYLPGPFCTQLLADFGAEVVKVEDPRGGDPGRDMPPHINGLSPRFYTVNRNKKSITLNLKTPEGKEIFKNLVKHYDIVLDQFRPGVMTRLGLGYEVLKEINPGLIYCALTGYGLNGPFRDVAGHDLNYLNLAGVTELIGVYQERPAMPAVQIADVAGGGMYTIIAILLALIDRKNTGRGQLCDIAMLDGSISLMAYTLGEWSGLGKLPERGNEVLTGGFACYNIYETKDNKYVSLGAVEEKFWQQFCIKLGREQYASYQWDKEKQAEILKDIRDIMKQKTRDEWVAFFADSDICFTPVLNLAEMSTHPQVLARNMIYKLQNVNESGQEIFLTGIPIKLSESPGQVVLDFPELGEHNREILMAAGYSESEIKEFKEKGII